MAKFELPLYLAALQRYKISVSGSYLSQTKLVCILTFTLQTAAGVPRIVAMLASDPLIRSYDLRHLKRFIVAGSATPSSVIKSCVNRLRTLPNASTNFSVSQCYVATEARYDQT